MRTAHRLVALIALMAIATAGCGLTRLSDQPETGPEQFNFVIVPGDQPPDETESAVAGMSDGTVEDAVHIGTVSTPFGQTDIYSFTQVNADGEWDCEAMVSPNGGRATCGQGEIDAVTAEEVKVSSTGTDGAWATVDLQVGDGIRSVVLTADDGTKYKTNVVAGFAMVVYPARRGGVVAQGFGGSDQPVGKPVIIESLP